MDAALFLLTGLDLISLLSLYNKSTSVWQEVEVRNPNVKTWSRAECETWTTGFFNQTEAQRLTAHGLILFNACRESGTHTRVCQVSDRNRRNTTACKISTLTGQLWRALQNISSSFHWALKMHFTRLHSLKASRLTAWPADTHHFQRFLHLTWHTDPLRTGNVELCPEMTLSPSAAFLWNKRSSTCCRRRWRWTEDGQSRTPVATSAFFT